LWKAVHVGLEKFEGKKWTDAFGVEKKKGPKKTTRENLARVMDHEEKTKKM